MAQPRRRRDPSLQSSMSLAKRHSVMDDLAERLESYFEGGGSLMPRNGRRKSLYEVIVKEPAVYDRNRADHWQLESNERRYIRKLFRALDVDSNGWSWRSNNANSNF